MLTEIELRNVMRRAFTLGETHWRLADSERTGDHRRAEDTRRQFEALVDGVVGLMAGGAAAGVTADRHQVVDTKDADGS